MVFIYCLADLKPDSVTPLVVVIFKLVSGYGSLIDLERLKIEQLILVQDQSTCKPNLWNFSQ